MDISDHYGIFHRLNRYCTSNGSSQLLKDINETRIEKYRECILNADWAVLNVYEDCETYYKHFMTMYFQTSKSRNDIEIDPRGLLQG